MRKNEFQKQLIDKEYELLNSKLAVASFCEGQDKLDREKRATDHFHQHNKEIGQLTQKQAEIELKEEE